MSEGPDNRPTAQLPAVPDWAVELTKSVKSGFAEVKADLSLVANDVTVVKDRVTVVESRVGALEESRKATSIRVRESQASDLEHAAQLAQLSANFQELIAKQTEAQTSEIAALVQRAAATPQGQKLLNAVVGLAATAVVVVWSRGTVTPVDDPRNTYGEPLVADDSDLDY
jgi:uncharacterized phage infection (PIP) family protein YhgE